MSLPAFPWPARVVPTLEVAGRFPLDDRRFETTYRHRTHALHLHEYAGRMQLGRHELALQPGDITFSVAGSWTRYDLPQAGHHWCVHFQPAPARGSAISLPRHIPAGPHRQHATDRLGEIARLHHRGNPARAAILFQDLLLWLAGRMISPRRSDIALNRLLTVLEERFAEPLAVPQLAATIGMSQDHLARCFRRRLGVTIPRYLLQRRIAHARHLLTTTDLPIHRIAARVGLPDPQHFNKQFRRLSGLSPSAARAQGDNR